MQPFLRLRGAEMVEEAHEVHRGTYCAPHRGTTRATGGTRGAFPGAAVIQSQPLLSTAAGQNGLNIKSNFKFAATADVFAFVVISALICNAMQWQVWHLHLPPSSLLVDNLQFLDDCQIASNRLSSSGWCLCQLPSVQNFFESPQKAGGFERQVGGRETS